MFEVVLKQLCQVNYEMSDVSDSYQKMYVDVQKLVSQISLQASGCNLQ